MNVSVSSYKMVSCRQKSLMKLGGLKGEIFFESNLGPFMPGGDGECDKQLKVVFDPIFSAGQEIDRAFGI